MSRPTQLHERDSRQASLATVYRYHDGTKHHFHAFAQSLGYLDWASQPSPFITIQREFPVHEDVRLEFRAEAYNVFNVTNYGTPERFVNTPQFGSVIMAATPARQMQFVGRLKF